MSRQFDDPDLTLIIDPTHLEFPLQDLGLVCRIQAVVAVELFFGCLLLVGLVSQTSRQDAYGLFLPHQRTNQFADQQVGSMRRSLFMLCILQTQLMACIL